MEYNKKSDEEEYNENIKDDYENIKNIKKKREKYWIRIRDNIKRLYNNELSPYRGNIKKRYNYKAFCKNFRADILPYCEKNNNCICGHEIYYNYKYYHVLRPNEYFIMGSCCIKLFSKLHKSERECIDCKNKLKKVNKFNRCNQCRDKYIICKECKKLHLKDRRYCIMCCEELETNIIKYKCFRCNLYI